MSATCLLVAGKATLLAAPFFTLGWTHSVEKTGWQEQWTIRGDQLILTQSRIKGSGAGMDPGPDAQLIDEWWVWHPNVQVPSLALAASGATGDGWHLCYDSTCLVIGRNAGDVIDIAPCGPARIPS